MICQTRTAFHQLCRQTMSILLAQCWDTASLGCTHLMVGSLFGKGVASVGRFILRRSCLRQSKNCFHRLFFYRKNQRFYHRQWQYTSGAHPIFRQTPTGYSWRYVPIIYPHVSPSYPHHIPMKLWNNHESPISIATEPWIEAWIE